MSTARVPTPMERSRMEAEAAAMAAARIAAAPADPTVDEIETGCSVAARAEHGPGGVVVDMTGDDVVLFVDASTRIAVQPPGSRKLQPRSIGTIEALAVSDIGSVVAPHADTSHVAARQVCLAIGIGRGLWSPRELEALDYARNLVDDSGVLRG